MPVTETSSRLTLSKRVLSRALYSAEQPIGSSTRPQSHGSLRLDDTHIVVSFPQARVCLFAHPPVPVMAPRRLSRSDLASSSMGQPCPNLQPHPFPFSECLAVTVTSRGLPSNQCDEPPRVRSSALLVRQFPHSLGRFPFMRGLTADGMEAALVYDFLPTTPAYAAATLDS